MKDFKQYLEGRILDRMAGKTKKIDRDEIKKDLHRSFIGLRHGVIGSVPMYAKEIMQHINDVLLDYGISSYTIDEFKKAAMPFEKESSEIKEIDPYIDVVMKVIEDKIVNKEKENKSK